MASDPMDDASTKKLVAALEEATAPDWLIADAKTGAFHDFKSKVATPILHLVTRLRKVGLEELAARAIAGEFDATPAESEAWAKSEDGQRAFRELTVRNPSRGR